MNADVKGWLSLSRELDHRGAYSCPDLHPDDIAKAVSNSVWLAEHDRAVKAEAWDKCASAWDRYCIGVREYNEGESAFPDTPDNPYQKGGDQ